MRERNNFILDVISDIDEEIIDKNLKKRFVLWSKKSKRRNSLLISLIAAAACFCIIAGTALYVTLGILPNGKQIPIYQGMTVSTEAPTANGSLLPSHSGILNLSASQNEAGRTILLDNSSGNNGNHYGNDKDSSSSVHEDNSTHPEVFGGTYYALKNEDIYIHVHLSNPDDFEILSFTLNGVKYSSNMFEYGSNLELLILKYNVGDVNGLQEYTIDAIKYVDGEAIKDVRMDGDRTVKVYVNDDTQPLNLGAQPVGFNLMIAPTWADDFTGDKTITSLSLWKDDEKLRDLDTDTTEISDLPSGERLILKATYLGADGEEKLLQYVFNTPKQSEGLAITDGVVTGIGTCPDSVLYINMPVGKYAFHNDLYIKEVYFGPDVKYVDEGAFKLSQSLKKVVFSNGTEYISAYAFDGCIKLETLILSNTLQSIGVGAFTWNLALTEVNIPESVKTIGEEAFRCASALTEVNISEGVTSIGSYAFDICSSLTSINIPDSVTSIGDYAFSDCPSLASINFNGTIAQWNAISKGSGWNYSTHYYVIHCTDGDISR